MFDWNVGSNLCLSGVRESRHLQTGQTCHGRSEGPGGVLCHPLCGHLREDRHEEHDI